jgi:hypothetical protein
MAMSMAVLLANNKWFMDSPNLLSPLLKRATYAAFSAASSVVERTTKVLQARVGQR